MDQSWHEDDDIQSVKAVAVSHRRGGSCCIHQTTTLIQTDPTDDQMRKLREAIAAARREIDSGDAAAQVAEIEAFVAQVKQMDAAMARERNRVEKLENELAELRRDLERERLENRGNPGKKLIGMAAEAFLPGGIVSFVIKVHAAWELLETIASSLLGD